MITGRIIKGVGGLYTVDTKDGVYMCKARGIFRKNKVKPMIGDFVEITIDNNEDGVINKIMPRKNEMIRPFVSNVDQVFIVFSIKSPEVNLDFLDRLIVFSEEIDLEIVICINKVDLCEKEEIEKIKTIYEKTNYKILEISTYDNKGIEEIKSLINNKVSVFAGPSGVGKSSIINLVCEGANMEIGNISEKIDRGKHTTRHSEIHKLNDGFLIDSPGFTSLFIENLNSDKLQYYFKEFEPYIGDCKYNNCLHDKETNCMVKEQVNKNINQIRYNRYVKFLREIKENRR